MTKVVNGSIVPVQSHVAVGWSAGVRSQNAEGQNRAPKAVVTIKRFGFQETMNISPTAMFPILHRRDQIFLPE
ncbi:hypothetical protein [Sinorhizobium americanum]|uniref:hypothetical protein n=1 Tax=Sinorhizobium americanum TaxID=194963 RepID=UPI001053402B|nr:hypothetical protein [Sinorhizobium americanum]